jgi:RNA polymerase sigma-70 factor (ECF subfamily)
MSGGALYTGTAMNSSEMSPPTSTEMACNDMACGCAMQAWQDHEAELLQFLLARLNSRDDAEDLLQELFVRLLQQGSSFCTVTQPKAWLYRVARNTLI